MGWALWDYMPRDNPNCMFVHFNNGGLILPTWTTNKF
jgi:hypothetical protein